VKEKEEDYGMEREVKNKKINLNVEMEGKRNGKEENYKIEREEAKNKETNLDVEMEGKRKGKKEERKAEGIENEREIKKE
jgi:hypothetical protein